MKDLLPKLTFGFLMAQLFPGAVAVLSITAVLQSRHCQPGPLCDLLVRLEGIWFGSGTATIVFLFLSAGSGMFIHGIHWATLAWLENHGEDGEPKAVCEHSFHMQAVWLQVLLGPMRLAGECLGTLRAPRTDALFMEENVPSVAQDKMAAFTFVQDFYLYFGQFYAHTAYALAIGCASFSVAWTFIGWSMERSAMAVALYLACGTCFVIGRIQLGSLFVAETAMVQGESKGAPEGETRPKDMAVDQVVPNGPQDVLGAGT